MNNMRHPIASTVITADARTVSPAEFMETVLPGFHERRANERMMIREQCIRAIRAGSTYGFPPMLVAECREMIAERDELVDASVTSLGDDWHRVTPS